MLEKICKELGVEIGEEWKATDGNTYCIDYDGTLWVGTHDIVDYEDNISRVLTGEVVPVWKPRYSEEYYIPSITSPSLYETFPWRDDKSDFLWLERNLVYKTKEEAVEVSKMIFNILKER